MTTIEKIQAGYTFWAGEDILNEYKYYDVNQSALPLNGGYITKGSEFYCDLVSFESLFMMVAYKFFGTWLEYPIYYKDIAFSTKEIVDRIKPVPVPKPKRITEFTKTDFRELAKYMDQVLDQIPNGLSRLKDALTFAMLDIHFYVRFGFKNKSFDKALAFGLSIPRFKNFESDECTSWMLNDDEHLTYMP